MSSANSHITLPYIYRKVMFGTLGLEENNTLLFWVLLALGAITFGGFWFFQGKVLIVFGILYLLGFSLLSVLRIDFSFYVVMFAIMIFDQFQIPGLESFTQRVYFFNNLKENPYVPYYDAAVLNPLEVHLLIIVFALFIRSAVLKDFSFKRFPILFPFLIFVAAFIYSCVYGLKQGGDSLIVLWEVRALFYLILMYLIVPQIIRSKEQIYWLVWVVILGITFKAFQAILTFARIGFTTGGYETLTNHEDPVFIVTLFVLLVGFLVYKSWNTQTFYLLCVTLPFLLAFYVAQRRAAYASCIVSFATFFVLLPGATRWKFLRSTLPILFGLVMYGAIFWNSNSILARPVQVIKSGMVEPTMEEDLDDFYSNLYREYENYNLAVTVRNNPVLGVGFGNKYEQPIKLVPIPFSLRDYIPHNEIYWVIVKMGAVGFFAFWFFFNSVAAKGVQIFARVHDPYLKAITLFVIIAIINQMVVSYFDLQLTYYRNMVYLGSLMGLLPAIEYESIKENMELDRKRNKKPETEQEDTL